MAFSSSSDTPTTTAPPTAGKTNRLFWRWWRKQSPSQQDRYATLGPLVSVLLFLAAIISAFWYLRNEEIEREQESVKRDTEVVQQQIRLRLIENQEQLIRLARDISMRTVNPEQFLKQAGDFVRARPEVISVSWVQADERIKASQSSLGLPLEPGQGMDLDQFSRQLDTYDPLHEAKEPEMAFRLAKERTQPVYSQPYANALATKVIQVHIPLIDRSGFVGTVVTEYSLEAMMRYLVPREVASRHAMSLVEIDGDTLTSTVGSITETSAKPTFVHEVVVTPVGNGLILRGMGFRTSSNLIGNTLFWMVMALSALTVWTLMGTLRHMRRRSQIQKTLVQETNFRRAMENSMLTGMRTIDLEGRITYVNPAFCAMTGFAEEELLGCVPPYPYWPKDRLDEFNRMYQQELLGRSPMGGIEVVMQRRDGSQFDARLYVSPLIDALGDQTGWMTSVTNITEAKRVRDQLTAAHERFTTVLEGLDAAVSVVSVQRGELLFANRSYRLWFGANPDTHAQLTGGELPPDYEGEADESVDSFGGLPTQELTNAGSDTREVFIDGVQKWFDVRARYVQWTDGHLAQMLIATDISSRKQAEDAAARQVEKAQPPHHHGRDGVDRGPRAQPAPGRHLQLLQRHDQPGQRGQHRERGPDRRPGEDLSPGAARRPDHPPHPPVREAQRAPAPACPRAGHHRRRDGVGRLRDETPPRHAQRHRGQPPAHPDGRPHPDRTGAAQPAEKWRRGHRRGANATVASPYRPARAAKVVRGSGRRGGVCRHRQRPRHEGRDAREALRGLPLHQSRRARNRPELVQVYHRVTPRSHQGREHLQWFNGCGVQLHLHPADRPGRQPRVPGLVAARLQRLACR